MNVMKAQTYDVPIAVCFETLCTLLPQMGVTVREGNGQRWTLYGEYQSTVTTGDGEEPAVIQGVCTPVYSNTSKVKLSYVDSNQHDTVNALVIETKMVAILNMLSNRLALVADPTARQGPSAVSAPLSSTADISVGQTQTAARRRAEWDGRSYALNAVYAGVLEEEIRRTLSERGYNALTTEGLILNARAEIRSHKNAALRTMLSGTLWFIGGLFITFFTYDHASGGGTYIIPIGAIIFGAIRFFRGLEHYLNWYSNG